MKMPKADLHTNEVVALTAIAKGRIPQMLVLYDDRTGTPIGYINLN